MKVHDLQGLVEVGSCRVLETFLFLDCCLWGSGSFVIHADVFILIRGSDS